ncbi:MAG: hypothetical protein U0934_13015 [Pseudotabrizicola sp.]|uniref:hypothetical protein n=1 Tax=Pseudotabrizicola sp. TaxID=2939647 RepID=UPI00272F01DD|nr:hypothetical protein [Pseudotabrizicola sp.]MDZ7574860.1 hypothetical protein [Pseudotabrizicola sp.]
MYLAQQMLSLLEEGSKPQNRAALVQVGFLSRWESEREMVAKSPLPSLSVVP